MLDCNKCGFHVNGNLKYAISSNTCPSCGSSLLSNEDIRSVEDVKRELINNGFSFSDSDMRLLGIYFTKKIKTLLNENQETLFTEDLSEDLKNDNNSTEEYKDFKKEVLDEVRKEAHSKLEEVQDGDPEDKVERLRRKAKSNSILRKQGASVRRVSD